MFPGFCHKSKTGRSEHGAESGILWDSSLRLGKSKPTFDDLTCTLLSYTVFFKVEAFIIKAHHRMLMLVAMKVELKCTPLLQDIFSHVMTCLSDT
jgi:hypothetical protein